MTDRNELDPSAPPPSADELRMKLIDDQMAEMKKREAARTKAQKELEDFTNSFLKEEVSSEEIAMVRRLVMYAVENGELEAMVYSFPAKLCTDKGRAINNSDPTWPDTLQGKAKQFYERFLEFGKPQGYKLKAMIINFPDDLPGDVGFFLNWE
ncbi:histidine kinase [Roseibium sp. M-1]